MEKVITGIEWDIDIWNNVIPRLEKLSPSELEQTIECSVEKWNTMDDEEKDTYVSDYFSLDTDKLLSFLNLPKEVVFPEDVIGYKPEQETFVDEVNDWLDNTYEFLNYGWYIAEV